MAARHDAGGLSRPALVRLEPPVAALRLGADRDPLPRQRRHQGRARAFCGTGRPDGIRARLHFEGHLRRRAVIDGTGATELRVIDPATGATHLVAGSQTPPGVSYSVFTAISGDFAWGTRITGSQAHPSYELLRLNLTDGTLVVWKRSATMPLLVLGFDADGHPIVNGAPISADGAQSNLVLLSAPDHTTPIAITGGAFVQGRGTPVSDAHGTWLGSADGSIWLYTAAGLEKVATIPPQPGGSGQPYEQHAWRSVAGPCF